MPFEHESGTTVTVSEQSSSPTTALPIVPSDPPARSPTPASPVPTKHFVPEPVEEDGDWDPADNNTNCGRIVLRDYRLSEADQPGCIFMIGVNYDLTIDTFSHKPYERLYNINHEDLSPMLYDSSIRGRLEQNDDGAPELILKEPHSSFAYFDLKEIESGRTAELFVDMVHDEYILIARKLLATGLPNDVRVHVTSAPKFLPDYEQTLGAEPFEIVALAELPLSTEQSA